MPHSSAVSDHDVLIRLDANFAAHTKLVETKLEGITGLLTELRAAVATKADAPRVEKLEGVVEGIKTKVATAAGGLAALQFVIHLLWK